MSMTGIIGRDQNVRHASTDSKQAEPKTVLQMVPLQMYAVEIGDENGKRKRVLAFRVGKQWFHDPVAEPWFDRLREIDGKTWLGKSLEERFIAATTPASAPKEDTVDIFAASTTGTK